MPKLFFIFFGNVLGCQLGLGAPGAPIHPVHRILLLYLERVNHVRDCEWDGLCGNTTRNTGAETVIGIMCKQVMGLVPLWVDVPQ